MTKGTKRQFTVKGRPWSVNTIFLTSFTMRRKGSKLYWDAILACMHWPNSKSLKTHSVSQSVGKESFSNNVDGSEKVQPLWKASCHDHSTLHMHFSLTSEIRLLKNFSDSQSWTWLHRPVWHYSNGNWKQQKNPSVRDSSNPPMSLYTGRTCSNLNPPNMEAVGALTCKGLQNTLSEKKSKLQSNLCSVVFILHWLLWKNYIPSFVYFLIKTPWEDS